MTSFQPRSRARFVSRKAVGPSGRGTGPHRVPAFLLVAWHRVRGKGAATAGVDRRTAASIEAGQGGGKLRRLGIATIADRVIQACLKLVLEPIFEADFLPCSYGFRPRRRAHDSVAEVRFFASAALSTGAPGACRASRGRPARARCVPCRRASWRAFVGGLAGHRVTRSQVGAGPWTRCTIAEITRYTPNAPAASTTIVRPYRESQPFTAVTTRIVGSGATAWARTGISMASM